MAKQFETVELTWNAPAPAGSSDVDIALQAEVTAPDQTVMTVKGFYAGEGKYAVRFLPLQTGTYHIKVTGEVSDEKTVEVEAGDGKHHGIVKAEGTHLQYSDGKYFYSFGTTVYALAHQTDELMNETIDTLAKSPFNKVRMCVFPKDYQYNKNEPQYYAFNKKEDGSWDPAHPDFRFWDAFEDKIHRLQDLGIEVDLILFHPYDRWGFSKMPMEDNLTYLDYLLRRFSAIPNVWWSLANEYDLIMVKTLDDWHAIEEKVAKDDPYHHLLSAHNCFPIYDFSRPNITHCSVQLRDTTLVNELQDDYHKPVLYDECRYEGNLQESWGNLSGEDMTRRFWQVTVSGGYCTHGETYLDPSLSDDQLDNAVVWWAKGGKLIGKSPERIAWLRKIVENLPGPLDPLPQGLANVVSMMKLPDEAYQQALARIPEQYHGFFHAIRSMSPIERVRHFDFETDFAGHVGEDVYLYYLDDQCTARKTINLPKDKTYKVEVLDTWNMTRETVAQDASGDYVVHLPGRPFMAILATKN